jgi:hypothetical protein
MKYIHYVSYEDHQKMLAEIDAYISSLKKHKRNIESISIPDEWALRRVKHDLSQLKLFRSYRVKVQKLFFEYRQSKNGC